MRNEHDGGKNRRTGLKVVLDTNVYGSAFHFPEGVCAQLVKYAAEQHYELIISPIIIREFAGASRRDFRVNEEKHLRFVKFLAKTATIVVPQIIPDVIKEDPPDNYILACALAGGANLIVSQDLDLLRLKTYVGVGIISPIDFLNTLGLKKAA
jgi:putative PIN family toxin of toxin-antitoxin system